MRQRYSNNAVATLDGAINNSTTTVVLTDGSSFPTKNFRLLVDTEFMFCTARSSQTLTVIRGIEGSTAASHLDDAPVTCVITGQSLSDLRLELLDFGKMVPKLAIGVTPSSDNDEFDDANFSGWTKVWAGSGGDTTIVERDHTLSVHLAPTSNNVFVSYMKSKPSIPGGGYIEWAYSYLGLISGYPQPTLWMANGMTYGAGNQVGFGYSPNEGQAVLRGNINYNSQTSFDGKGIMGRRINGITHQRLIWNSANNYSTQVSCDGKQWSTAHSGVATSESFSPPTHVGFGFTTWGGTASYLWSVKYFRCSW